MASTSQAEPAARPELQETVDYGGEARTGQVLVWVFFFLSGACGLAYEVLWCRHLGLIFGNTVHSLSAVLTAFMGGLALGSFVAGRFCHKLRRPLLAYGVLELLIGIYCAALPWVLSDGGPVVRIYRALYTESEAGGLSLMRFGITFLLLLVPTTFMGATLPVLSHHLVRSRQALGRTVGTLYAINSLGAVAGALATGFLLLPETGKQATNSIAVICNLLLGLGAILLGRRVKTENSGFAALAHAEDSAAVAPAATPATNTAHPVSPLALKLCVLIFGVTGFAAMATQIGWTRAISLGTGSSTYAFSLIVAIFILGLSLGGMWAARQAPRLADPLGLLAKLLVLIGVANLAISLLLGYGPFFFFLLLAWGSTYSWSVVLAAQAFGVALLIVLPTFLMGTTLPLTMQVAARSSVNAGRTVGTIYAVNTVGAILGSFLGGLVILPALGIQNSLEVMAVLYALPGLVLFLFSASARHRRSVGQVAAMVLLLLVAAAWGPRWDPLLMSSGAYLLRDDTRVKAAREMRLPDAMPNLAGRKMLYYREGAAATVAVFNSGENVTLTVGGKPDASSHGDMPTQITLTLLPEILHPNPKDVLVIGLGSGVSAGAALAPRSVEQVDVVEMSPEVVAGSYYFKDYNGLTYQTDPAVRIDTPRLRLIINDGRNHLLLSSRKYDIIASEPSNPWMAGVGNLFTREAFQLARGRLKDGGIMCQWIHSYSLEPAEFFSILGTFASVFDENYQLWCVGYGDFLLLGSNQPVSVELDELRRRMNLEGTRDWLRRIRFTDAELLACFLADHSSLARPAASARLHTDDNMLLEYAAPRSLYRKNGALRGYDFLAAPERIIRTDKLAPEARAQFVRALDLALAAREHVFLGRGSSSMREEHFEAAQKLTPRQFWVIEHQNQQDEAQAQRILKGQSAFNQTLDPGAALALLEGIKARSEPEWWPRQALALAHGKNAVRLLKAGDPEGCLAELEQAGPRSPANGLMRARALAAKGDNEAALAEAVKAGSLGGITALDAAEVIAGIHHKTGRVDAALKTIDEALKNPELFSLPQGAPLWYMRAQILLSQSKPDAALESVRAAARRDSNEASYPALEGHILFQQFKMREAMAAFRQRALLDPLNESAVIDLCAATFGYALLTWEKKQDAEGASDIARYGRRLAVEATTLYPRNGKGWELLARNFMLLAKCLPAHAEYHNEQARAALQGAVKAYDGDSSKLPPDLRVELK